MDDFLVRFTREATSSLHSIAEYIIADSPQNAEEVALAIVAAIDSLKTSPSRFKRVGKCVRDGTPVHRVSTHSFNIYYRVDSVNQSVEVLFIRRGARRQPRRFP